ncbi:MAG: tRNA (adenosine(37)-N6)-threonylcarbamoyltransferase complex ATPase subunit type 1 TsaE [Alphaproteobacteria bacterium]|nr:tRNA (adenosine(37)-N6)-threonylcarbamoyltransferase complex ATPase subunit type 1 TsaE [Alphaproteobacteria bacterium]
MTDPITFTVELADEAATAALMADLALLVGSGCVITLSGDLGAGKSAAARAMIRYFAGDDALEVPSPTFTLVQLYDLGAVSILHADLYRVEDPGELEEIGLCPLPEGVLALVEWPERAGGTLAASRIDIALTHDPEKGENARDAVISGSGPAAAIVERLQALRGFLSGAGLLDAPRRRMAGDASTRSYARLQRGEDNVILMNSPRRADGAASYGGKPYSAVVHLAEDVTPFVAIASGLTAAGFSAPVIHTCDLQSGFLITEDFGREAVVEGDPSRPIVERYEAATDMLAALHARPLPRVVAVGETRYRLPEFDHAALEIEVGLMPEWYLRDRGITLSVAVLEEFGAIWRDLLAFALAGPKNWVLRDFHSPNLIWLSDRTGIARVGVIDFQDAVWGPEAYDVVSLLQDARVDVAAELEKALFARYVKARQSQGGDFDAARFAACYAIMSAQRNTRLLGTFARLNCRDGKPQYLRHLPRVWTYLGRALEHPQLAAYRRWVGDNLPAPA